MKVEPVHEPAVGVTVYTTCSALIVVLVSVWLIEDCAVPVASPVMFVLFTNVQEYVVLEGTMSEPLEGVTVNTVPLQVFAVVLAIVGIGLTVTVTVNGVPVQPELTVAKRIGRIGYCAPLPTPFALPSVKS